VTTNRKVKRQETAVARIKSKPPRAAAPRVRGVRPLVTAPPEKCFCVHYGPVLKDLRELRHALDAQISPAQFAHHVGLHGNDFANWVEHVLDEPTCARRLRAAHTVADALRTVDAALCGQRS